MILQILITADYKSNGNSLVQKCGILPVNIYMVLLQRSCVYKAAGCVFRCRSKTWLCSVTTSSSAAVAPVFMSGKVHACSWGLGNTGPFGSRFPQSLLSHKEQCHVAKFKSMRSAFCLLFLACQKVLLQTPSRTNLFALTQTRPSAKQDTLALSTLLVCISVLSKPAHQGEQPACGIITDCYAMMQNRPAWSMPITLHVISYQNLRWIHLSDLEQQAN